MIHHLVCFVIDLLIHKILSGLWRRLKSTVLEFEELPLAPLRDLTTRLSAVVAISLLAGALWMHFRRAPNSI